MSRLKCLLFLPLCLAAAVLVQSAARAQEGGDLQAQILYAFHSEDTNQLTSLIQTLSTQVQAGGADSALRYHLAHAEYRLGLLSDAKRARAEAALGACVEQLKPVLQEKANSVEAMVLQSACYANLARFERLEAMLLRSHAADRLAEAFKLEPRNPRVVLFKAMNDEARAKPASVDSRHAFEELELAAQLFEQSSATRIEVPGWGHAEAYLELGRRLQARGDALDARNWIEKSLIVAPDFKAAQRQLASLVRH